MLEIPPLVVHFMEPGEPILLLYSAEIDQLASSLVLLTDPETSSLRYPVDGEEIQPEIHPSRYPHVSNLVAEHASAVFFLPELHIVPRTSRCFGVFVTILLEIP